MNKILAILCAVGAAAVAAVVTYIVISQASAVENKSPSGTSPPGENKPLPGDTLSPGAAMHLEGRLVADSLENPCAVAVQPETGHLFVSTKDRIVRIVPGDKYTVHDEITGFSTDFYGKGPIYAFGPLGLAFADPKTLVVGDGSQPDGAEIVRIYNVGLEPLPRGKVRKTEDMISSSTPIPPGEDSFQGEGNFFGVAIHGSTVFITSNGDDSKGWICKLELDLKKPPPLKLIPFIKSKDLTDTNAPMGAVISPQGKLVVCQFGSTNKYPDSLLTIYDPATGKLEKKLETGLFDLIAIAYSPKTGILYGLDFSWADPAKGGLFRLELGGDQVKAVRLADLGRPTGLAFSPGGTLYVTVIGAHPEKGKRTGQLLVFEGL